MSEKKGSVIGGALLIAGSCIGAGMLILPILSGIAGFFPSMLMFAIAGIFMTTTGLLLVEATSWFDTPVNLNTLIHHTLGPVGMFIGWIMYLFLFYTLIVAYIAGSGNHVGLLLGVPVWVGSLFFVLVFGWMTYLGAKTVDLTNRLLMVGKIGAFLLLIVTAAEYVKPEYLENTKIEYTFLALPILVISFGFQNMVPTLVKYMDGDTRRVKQAVIAGASFVFVIYIVWQVIAIGTIPVGGTDGLLYSYINTIDAAQAITSVLASPLVKTFATALAFFAILTSFLSQTLSLVHFLEDWLKISHGKREHPGLCLLALGPSLMFAMAYPHLFFAALNFAGGICAVILFGILPVLMVWRGRYWKGETAPQIVGGGKPLLGFIFVFACLILFYQLSITLGFELFPRPTTF